MENALLVLSTLVLFNTTAFSQSDLDAEELEQIMAAAQASNSDAIYIVQGDEVLLEWYSTGSAETIELMSVLKSVVAIGIGRLLELEHIKSLDQPVHEFFPEWKQGRKEAITIRHLLNHTSGLQNNPNAGVEIYPSPDVIQLALAAELSSAPGTEFRYNNKAVNLLAGIFEQAAGRRMDEFLNDELFKPMGIGHVQWHYDDAGNPYAMAGLRLRAPDLAKFGQLILNDGQWNNTPLIDPAFIQEMLDQAQAYVPSGGLLWWRMSSERRLSINEAKIRLDTRINQDDLAALIKLSDQDFPSTDDLRSALIQSLSTGWQQRLSDQQIESFIDVENGPVVAFYGDGYLGQTILVMPKHNIVAVRQIKNSDDYNRETDSFQNFRQLVNELATN